MDQPFPLTPSFSSSENEFRCSIECSDVHEFNSGRNREAKSLYKKISVPVPRPLRIPESGEITPLFSFRKAVFLPFTVAVNGLATIVATQSLQFGAVSANSAIRCCFSIAILVVVAVATIVVVSQFWFSSKMVVLTFPRNMTSSFEILKI